MKTIIKVILISLVSIIGLTHIILKYDLFNDYKEIGSQNPKIFDNQQNKQQNLREEDLIQISNSLLTGNKMNYDLNSNMEFQLNSLNQYIQVNTNQDQVMPFVLSIKTKDQVFNLNDSEANNLTQTRPGIDLVCVIDNSGSMYGDKIENVKTTLAYLVQNLNENDRLSLILFDSSAQVLTNLIKMNTKNKNEINTIINSIETLGGTNISSGMREAFQILKDRKYVNHVTSVFLLSDGQDNESRIRVKNLLTQQYEILQNQLFTIHSFGFGRDHDSKLMNEIASLKDGNFYYIEKIIQIDEFFASALGGLFSVIAQDIIVDLSINKNDSLFERYFQSAYISNTYGDNWSIVKQGEKYQVKINQLLSGVSKDFVFEMTFPKSSSIHFQNDVQSIQILNSQLKAKAVGQDSYIIKETHLKFKTFNESDIIPEMIKLQNDDVEYHLFRVKSAQVIQNAIKQADNGQYDEAKLSLERVRQTLSGASPNAKNKLKYVERDIEESITNVQPNIYRRDGSKKLLNFASSNIRQSSQMDEDCIYQNTIQKEFVAKQKQKKQN